MVFKEFYHVFRITFKYFLVVIGTTCLSKTLDIVWCPWGYYHTAFIYTLTACGSVIYYKIYYILCMYVVYPLKIFYHVFRITINYFLLHVYQKIVAIKADLALRLSKFEFHNVHTLKVIAFKKLKVNRSYFLYKINMFSTVHD